MMLLIDIGNTSIVCALYNENTYLKIIRIEKIINVESKLNSFLKYKIQSIAICSVSPNKTDIFIEKINKIFKMNPFIVSHQNSNVKLNIENPKEVGADRICNVKAAIQNTRNSCIVVDFGTATTYDVINQNKEFIGGAIAPGIDISANYLIEKAALLKETVLEFPSQIIAKNTKTNIQSGVMYGAIYSIEGMIKQIEKELKTNVDVILTGGFSVLISPKISIRHTLKPNLTLDGIREIFKENN